MDDSSSNVGAGVSERCVFVTGGAGLLGSALVSLARSAGWAVVAPSSADLDVRDADAVDGAIAALAESSGDAPRTVHGHPFSDTADSRRTVDVAPSGASTSDSDATWIGGRRRAGGARTAAIVHLAYRRDERDTIVDGSANVARAAARCGIRLVHLSTDALFAGRPEPYTEADAPDPVHDYGRWKAGAERAVAELCPRAVLVRTSLMYRGDGTSACELDVRRVLDGASSMRFFTDEIRCFSDVADVAAGVLRLAELPEVGGALHVAAAEPIDRAGFARLVAARLGVDPAPVPTSSIAASGLDRPGRVVLDVSAAARLGITCRGVSTALATL